MTLIASPRSPGGWSPSRWSLGRWSPGRWWRARRVERAVLMLTSAPTTPLPVPTHAVHDVVASWGATAGHGAAWTLRFGPAGPTTVVERLAGAEADAQALVAAALGVPAPSLRVRIVPDDRTVETVAALRRDRGARRPVWRPGARRV